MAINLSSAHAVGNAAMLKELRRGASPWEAAVEGWMAAREKASNRQEQRQIDVDWSDVLAHPELMAAYLMSNALS